MLQESELKKIYGVYRFHCLDTVITSTNSRSYKDPLQVSIQGPVGVDSISVADGQNFMPGQPALALYDDRQLLSVKPKGNGALEQFYGRFAWYTLETKVTHVRRPQGPRNEHIYVDVDGPKEMPDNMPAGIPDFRNGTMIQARDIPKLKADYSVADVDDLVGKTVRAFYRWTQLVCVQPL